MFGKRQDPNGAYAAVIPHWIGALIGGDTPVINGDGEISRDFCYISRRGPGKYPGCHGQSREALNKVYNIAYGDRTTLKELFVLDKESASPPSMPETAGIEPVYGPIRKGDVLHSLADISRAMDLLGYAPIVQCRAGHGRNHALVR